MLSFLAMANEGCESQLVHGCIASEESCHQHRCKFIFKRKNSPRHGDCISSFIQGILLKAFVKGSTPRAGDEQSEWAGQRKVSTCVLPTHTTLAFEQCMHTEFNGLSSRDCFVVLVVLFATLENESGNMLFKH